MAKVWQYKDWQMVLASTLAVSVTLIIPATDAFAQNITLDGSLGTAGTLTGPNYAIPQSVGQTAGNNLFHSFGKFNLNTNEAAIFQSADNIRNILSRVTGGTPSSIDGLIRTENSNVNFFLMNPSGIIFGRNARLDVSGSFVASTANAMQFGDRGFFSATSPETPSPLLTVNPSAFFFNQLQPGRIENKSTAPIGNNFSGLRVPDGRSLLLVGGDIAVDGGRLYALGGRVELAGIGGEGTVGLFANHSYLGLSFPGGVPRADVSITNGAQINVRSGGGGSIAINARNINISGGSTLSAGIQENSGLDDSQAGDITLDAHSTITVADGSAIENIILPRARGQGGNLTIKTGRLRIQEDSTVVRTDTEGQGNAGNLLVEADSVEIVGPAEVAITTRSPVLRAASTRNATGNGGNLTIKTKNLVVRNAQVSVSTFNTGNAGNLTVYASDSIELSGKTFDRRSGSILRNPAGLFSNVNAAEGKGGNITIKTNRLSISDGAKVQAATFGEDNEKVNRDFDGNAGNIEIHASDIDIFETANAKYSPAGIYAGAQVDDDQSKIPPKGKGGSITIETNRLRVRDGGRVTSFTQGIGNAGTLRINANQVEVYGRSGEFTSEISAAAEINPQAIYTDVKNPEILGSGGDLIINTNKLIVRDGGRVTVRNEGPKQAGNIEINAGSINLDNQGSITATSASGNGGNIKLKSRNLLLLRNNSQISTSAGNRQFGGDGGNIDIDAGFIVAIPKENSDITANAFSGEGGRVDIKTNGIFGIKPQERETQESDITASSELGVSGQVTINTLEVDPSRGLVQLPSNLVDASRQIAQGCTPKGRQTASRFIATGRGGLPLSPNEPLRGRAAIASWVTLPAQATDRQTNKLSASIKGQSDPSVTKSTPQIVEAQGWVLDPKGETHLVAQIGRAHV